MRSGGRDKLIGAIREGLATQATTFSGEALFVPSPTDFAAYLGISKGLFYHFGTDYNAKLSEASGGLQVVHNGIVLTGEQRATEANTPQSQIDALIIQAEALSSQDRAQLIARLAITSTQQGN